MSYAEQEKKKALDEQNKIINESDLRVVELRHTWIPFYLVLMVIGLLVLGVCFLVYGV